MFRTFATQALFAAFALTEAVAAAPTLKETELYTTLTHDCRPADLATSSPQILRLLKKPYVTVDKTELCNQGEYTVLFVRFKYDPHTATSSFFNPLYARVAEANGRRPFSFVDVEDRVVVNVKPDQQRNIDVQYEDYY